MYLGDTERKGKETPGKCYEMDTQRKSLRIEHSPPKAGVQT